MSKIEKYVCDGCGKELCKVGHGDYAEFRFPGLGTIQTCQKCAAVAEYVFKALKSEVILQPRGAATDPRVLTVWFGKLAT